MKLVFLALVLPLALPAQVLAELKLPGLFSDNQVLQREIKVPVWGWDTPGTKVTVSFDSQVKRTVAGANGKWMLHLDPLKANASPQMMAIQGTSAKILNNILVGEVWICSGQSNMAMTLGKSKHGPSYTKEANYPALRLFHVSPKSVSPLQPVEHCGGSWLECTPDNAAQCSAVGFYFILELHQKLKVPVGIIKSAWGGSTVEAWTSREALTSDPTAKPLWDAYDSAVTRFDESTATPQDEAQRLMKRYAEAMKISRREKTKRPRLPKIIRSPIHARFSPTNFFNTMIAPIIPYGIRGVVWYQGESNRSRSHQYLTTFPLMVQDWRTRFQLGDFPFYYVQIANLKGVNDEPEESEWAEMQHVQTESMKRIKNSGMATISDYPDTTEDNNLHPKNKLVVGERLARWALVKTYGFKEVVCSGPIYRSMKKEDGQIRINFDYVSKGLRTQNGDALRRFQICGDDRKWVWAEASIEKDTVVVKSQRVKNPVAVRYAWSQNARDANLTNESGLPAPIFRTDDWPLTTQNTVNREQKKFP